MTETPRSQRTISDGGTTLPFDPDDVSDEHRDTFIRGVLACEIWAYVLDKEPVDFVDELQDGDRLEAEWTKAMHGEENELGEAVADEYDIPYQYYGDRLVLDKEYQRRYRTAFSELDIEPSWQEKLVNTTFFSVMGRE